MKNGFKIFGIVLLLAAAGFSVISCDEILGESTGIKIVNQHTAIIAMLRVENLDGTVAYAIPTNPQIPLNGDRIIELPAGEYKVSIGGYWVKDGATDINTAGTITVYPGRLTTITRTASAAHTIEPASAYTAP